MIDNHSDNGTLPTFFNLVEDGLESYRVGVFIIFLDSEGGEPKFHRDDCFSPECEVERSLTRWEPLSSLIGLQYMMKLVYPGPPSSVYSDL